MNNRIKEIRENLRTNYYSTLGGDIAFLIAEVERLQLDKSVRRCHECGNIAMSSAGICYTSDLEADRDRLTAQLKVAVEALEYGRGQTINEDNARELSWRHSLVLQNALAEIAALNGDEK